MGKLIEYLQKENYFKYFLPIFRIYLCFHIVKKIFINYSSTSIFFDDSLLKIKTETYQSLDWLYSTHIFDIPLLLYFILITCVLYVFGIGRWFTVVILFIQFNLYTEASMLSNNGGDNYLFFILIYMIFVDSYYFLSFKKTTNHRKNHIISNLGGFAIMIHLCLIYLVSALHKIHADVWFNGVATYYILNLERYSSPLTHYFSKNAFILIFSNYFTIAVELLFPFLVWFKRFRNLFLISGLSLHLGIYVFMMIYDFEILFMMVYGFFLTNKEWKALFYKISNLKIMQRFNLKIPSIET